MPSTAPRIIVDARCLRGAAGGVATYTAALVEHLPRLLPNVPIVLIRHPDAGRISNAPGVSEWLLDGIPNHPWTFLRMGRWLNERLGQGDLFHAPYRMLPRGVASLAVLTMHDAMQIVCPELVFPNPVLRPVLHRYWSAAVRDSLRHAGRILAVSRHSAADTVRVDPACAPRVRVTHLGVDRSFHPLPAEEALRASAAIVPEGMRFFLVLGGGYPNKNHAGAIAAFARAFTASDPFHLLLIQRERTLPREIARALGRAGLSGRVHVRSEIGADALVALYNRAEALLFPSLYEGFGLPVLEAMACGCPVVSSNLTSLPEVAGDAALLCDPRDIDAFAKAMRSLSSNDALRRDLSARGRERARGFSWETTARETIATYRELAPWIPPPSQ
jgi:glycosyltransferase involved in cell wall biosynthesis